MINLKNAVIHGELPRFLITVKKIEKPCKSQRRDGFGKMCERVQVLVAAVNKDPDMILGEMNLQSDTIVANQCDEDMTERYYFNGHVMRWYSFNERGVGLNRNNALLRADSEICLIADDDMRYHDGYPEIVEKAFDLYPKADVIVFNVDEPKGKPYVIKKPFKVNKFNYMRFATFRIAFRRESVHRRGVAFNLSFGGGTKFAHGEDSLFLCDCLNKGLRIMALPISIAALTYSRKSTWFNGFDDKYFSDQGALYAAISRKTVSFLCLQDVVRHRRKYARHGGMLKNYKMMKRGARAFLNGGESAHRKPDAEKMPRGTILGGKGSNQE